ncbi:uncharacterized protein LOC127708287 isoform X3 [Mytilus californianus]|uniref:uncharacterized protein LOC127708287 isoform X1 n=1 Tax=Mytilus californianus TaxID=6549 RepID=UPI0022466B65|nr:uncharacterized protein LOC127708287 isoform X1 [Mytilus californianus]XP_052069092.1 uncharacterized protein LOC127708287 isoform X2 [Mytilus californianus]XP_052069093.1 uncharacterized protein LOC127708287 isoform X3 [Mytilus californianus]
MLFLFVLTAFLKLHGTIAFEIFINENRSGLLGSNDTSLECSFNKAEGEDILSLFFLYKNKTSHSYEDIVVFTSSAVPRLTAKGNYLSERIDLPKHTLSSSPAAITFSDLQCQDNARYKCRITYQIRRTFEKYTVESYATQINVQVLPLKPQLTTFFNASTTPTQRAATRKSTRSTNSPLNIKEGDIVTFVCNGIVGNPPASFIFQKFRQGHILADIYANTTMQLNPIDDMCYFNGKSVLTIQVMSEDNQAIIRCIANSDLTEKSIYTDSPTIKVFSEKLTTPSICTGSCPGSNENAENSNTNKVDLIVTGVMIAIGLIGIIVSVAVWKYRQWKFGFLSCCCSRPASTSATTPGLPLHRQQCHTPPKALF